ncbi:V-type immunoglobulin domain-containing suppressor of T-cell activation [Trichomycterus rosablanca]|uniref:V-type immunoglobulin domain-containing suppressor of T-cell activation n=1 Tax=Trichomycterus rosablanca TaxID=2290929 RepID=UPI002F35954C
MCFHLFAAVGANSENHLLSVSAQYDHYICPEGSNVTMVCLQSGALASPKDHLQHVWLYTPHMDQQCTPKNHPRLHHKGYPNQTLGILHNAQASSFSITLLDVKQTDQGRYCCMALDLVIQGKHKPIAQQHPHSHMLLTITPRRNDSLKCYKTSPPPPQGSVAAGLATTACIVGILCLPILLVLVYRQRQRTQGSRRAHELVRMDSEAQGHENPLYLEGSPKPKGRTVSQILTRQTSETGLHLLSNPGTPFSPNTQGDVFFPAQEPIPELPDFQQV